MERIRFSRNAIASSRGAYVHNSHIAYIRKWHEINQEIVASITATITVKPKYYAKCFGALVQVTEVQAKMLGRDMIIIQ